MRAPLLQNGISALLKETPKSSFVPSAIWCHSKNMTQEEGSHQTLNMPAPCSWNFQPAELWELTICCLGNPVCDIFVIAAVSIKKPKNPEAQTVLKNLEHWRCWSGIHPWQPSAGVKNGTAPLDKACISPSSLPWPPVLPNLCAVSLMYNTCWVPGGNKIFHFCLFCVAINQSFLNSHIWIVFVECFMSSSLALSIGLAFEILPTLAYKCTQCNNSQTGHN